MAQALSESGEAPEVETFEDKINRIIEAKKLLPNASYFAFTATPKYKTRHLFDEPGPEGNAPFHEYTMRQAIEEGFILDVLASYTTYKAYWRLLKTVEASEIPRLHEVSIDARVVAFALLVTSVVLMAFLFFLATRTSILPPVNY